MKLEGKVAFITGAAQGIGAAIARALAGEGCNIVISDINLDLALQTAAAIKQQGVKTLAVRANVADIAEVEQAVKQASAEFGRIDILVNNAGITRDGLLVRMKPEDWEMVLKINLTGAFNMLHEVAPLMMKAKSGKIINIASIVGLMGNFGQANYAAAKAGMIGLTKTAARELASRGVTVNAIAPGFIDTEMTRKLTDEVKEKLKAQIPMGKLGQPEDVAQAVLFLATGADYITGQVISVNGGMLM
jgi:3-oxoacyl-[acyl-carrier protein] reductase